MNRVLDVGRRARETSRRAELRRRGRPERRAVPRPRPSGRLRDTWPSARLNRPTPAAAVRLVGARAEKTTVAERATLPAAARVTRPGRTVPVPLWTRAPSAPADVTSPAEPAEAVAPAAVAPVAVAPVAVAPAASVPVAPVSAPEPAAPAPLTGPVAIEPPAEPTPGRTAPPRPRRARAWVAVAAAVVVVGGGVTAVVAVTRDGGTSSSVAAVDRSEVVSWLGANVPTNASVAATDPALRRSVAGGRVTVDEVGAAEDVDTGTYLVRTAGTADPSTPVALDDGRAVVNVAGFGSGASAVLVGQVVDHSTADVAADQRTERDTARAAASGLLANAAVTVASAARPSFQAGQLDLRAAAFLALLANQTPVTVLDVRTDPAERAVDLPDRRVVVTVDDLATLRAAISGTRAPYSPELTSAPADLPTDSVVLTFPLLADPTSVVS